MNTRCRSVLVWGLPVLLALVCLSSPQVGRGADDGFNRPDQDISKWERSREDLLWGFSNMYQPCVREIPGDEYHFRMWFFGWAMGIGNKGCTARKRQAP